MAIRKHFTDAQIETAVYTAKGDLTEAAKNLSETGHEVTRQLLRHWLIKLGKWDKKCKAPSKAVLKPVDGPRILFIDIETAPVIAAVWGLWKQNIGLSMINKDWHVLSVCWSWGAEDVYHYIDQQAKQAEGALEDDRDLLEQIWHLLDEADLVVAHNGQRFDVKKLNARLILNGFAPYRPIKVVDTLLFAKQKFGFTSNKLEYLSDKLTDEPKDLHSKFPGYYLWQQCLLGNPEAWAEMKQYNPQDVRALKGVYFRMRPWVDGHPNVAAYYSGAKIRCPKCGSTHMAKAGRALTQTGEYIRYKCRDCGAFARSRYTLNSIKKRQSLLSQ